MKLNFEATILKKEQKELLSKISETSNFFSQKEKIINELLKNENRLYRPIVNLQPISPEMLQPGFGGSGETYNNKNFGFLDTLNLLMKSIAVKTEILKKISKETDQGINTMEKRIAQIPCLQPISPGDLSRVGDGFKMRFHPILQYWRPHKGVDLIALSGKPVYAPSKGKVVSTRYSNSFGNIIEIDHSFQVTTLYCHLSKILVKPGDKVNMGDTIGLVGSTGLSSGAHLHYEVHVNGKAVDPKNYIHTFLNEDDFLEIVSK